MVFINKAVKVINKILDAGFADEYHTEIGSNIYHICEFAERMERNGHTYEPKPQEPPHKTVRHKEYER